MVRRSTQFKAQETEATIEGRSMLPDRPLDLCIRDERVFGVSFDFLCPGQQDFEEARSPAGGRPKGVERGEHSITSHTNDS